MYWLPAFLAALAAMELYDYFVLRGRCGAARFWGVSLLSVAAVVWPFLSPAQPILRFVLGMVVFNKIIKTIELAYGRVSDPQMVATFGRYLFWSLNFPDTQWPATRDDAVKARQDGMRRLGRFLAKAVVSAGLVALLLTVPAIRDYYWLKITWWLFLACFGFSGVSDFVTGSAMLTGVRFIEMFDSPLLARSPREFWSKRWNLYFREVCHRNVFLPLGGAKRPLLAVCAVFAVSALMHEYLIFVSIGWNMIGYMSAFFALHCCATIAQTLLGRMLGKKKLLPRPVAIILHIAWMILTSPLLIMPLLQIFPIM